MNIVFFTHPSFLGSQSMPRYARMLAEGMRQRNHNVEVWTAEPTAYNLSKANFLKKWLGYIDQYILFPREVKRRLKNCADDTLFVFTDHALGPWVPLVKNRPHVIHCHDFLAQRSALGEIPENRTSFTGRSYQSFIRRGYKRGKNFISISKKTQEDLHHFLGFQPQLSEVVYNGLNQAFDRKNSEDSRRLLSQRTKINLMDGYILHIGGNQWYKNRAGVVNIYNAWRRTGGKELPLLLTGLTPNVKLFQAIDQSPYKRDIHVLTGIEDEFIPMAYSGAKVFLFPSLAEGFGWPIAEAMASGTPVITTNKAPMTEVAADTAFLIPEMPQSEQERTRWAESSAEVVEKVVNLSVREFQEVTKAGLDNAKRFDAQLSLDKMQNIYENILKNAIFKANIY